MATNYFQLLPSGGGLFPHYVSGLAVGLIWPKECGMTLWDFVSPQSPCFCHLRQQLLSSEEAWGERGKRGPAVQPSSPTLAAEAPPMGVKPPETNQPQQSHQLSAATWVSSGKTSRIMRNIKLFFWSQKDLLWFVIQQWVTETWAFLSLIPEILNYVHNQLIWQFQKNID